MSARARERERERERETHTSCPHGEGNRDARVPWSLRRAMVPKKVRKRVGTNAVWSSADCSMYWLPSMYVLWGSVSA
jgi:hypothetical protein